MISSDSLSIYLDGITTPDNPLGDGTTFTWNCNTDANQTVSSGIYYIKFEEQDVYGHTDVVIKEISIMAVQQYVEVSIFNSAGELVRTLKQNKDMNNTSISLKVGDKGVVVLEKGGNNINITYGTGLTDYMSWDGLNDHGIAVTSGNYEVQVNVVTDQGRSTVVSKTITIISENAPYIGYVSILPNPYVGSESQTKQIKFAWVPGQETGSMNVTVYNVIGEKVKSFDAPLQTGYVLWDLKTGDDSKAANGYYAVVFQSKNSAGRLDRKTLKLAIMGKK